MQTEFVHAGRGGDVHAVQSPSPEHPHCHAPPTDTHRVPPAAGHAAQSTQVPDEPQVASASPLMQWPPEQQNPSLQLPSLPAVLHWSAQAPARQVGVPALHVTHTPLAPQATFAVPTTHVPPVAAEQQPPLQLRVELQDVVQVWVDRSHAAPASVAVAAGQSVVALQPQLPETQS